MSEYPLPYGGPTHSTQTAGRTLNALSYVLALFVALGGIFAPSGTLLSAMSHTWVSGTSGTLAVLSIVGLAAVIARRWRVEWVTATALAFLLLGRAVPVWENLFSVSLESTSAAAMMTLGAICLAQRALSLWVFAIRTRQVAERADDVG